MKKLAYDKPMTMAVVVAQHIMNGASDTYKVDNSKEGDQEEAESRTLPRHRSVWDDEEE